MEEKLLNIAGFLLHKKDLLSGQFTEDNGLLRLEGTNINAERDILLEGTNINAERDILLEELKIDIF